MKCPHSKQVPNPSFIRYYKDLFGKPYENTKGEISYTLNMPIDKFKDIVYDSDPSGNIWDIAPFLEVPCGKCMICMSNKKQDWIVRLKHELSQSLGASFVTLTYDDLHLPFKDIKGNYHRLIDEPLINEEAHQTVYRQDIQLFMKRLNKHMNKYGICGNKVSPRVFGCAEYGGKLKRPHYHLILFNVPHRPVGSYDPYKLIGEKWQMGLVDIGNVSGSAINYVASYIDLKDYKPMPLSDPQFPIMSRRPGIGNKFLSSEERQRYYDFICLLENRTTVSHDGIKQPLPRYYKDKLYSQEQKLEKQMNDYANRVDKTEYDELEELRKRNQSLVKEKLLHERAIKRKLHLIN